MWTVLKKIYREEGWRGFFRGNGTNCIRIVPYSAVQFGTNRMWALMGPISHLWANQIIFPHLQPILRTHHLPTSFIRCCFVFFWLLGCLGSNDWTRFMDSKGALAGVASVVTTYPLDIARTRLSLLHTSKPSIISTIKNVYVHEGLDGAIWWCWRCVGGVRGIYRGLCPTIYVRHLKSLIYVFREWPRMFLW